MTGLGLQSFAAVLIVLGAGRRAGLAGAPRRLRRRCGQGPKSIVDRDGGAARRTPLAGHRRGRGPPPAARPDADAGVAWSPSSAAQPAAFEQQLDAQVMNPNNLDDQRRRHRRRLGAAADRPAADADLVPAGDPRDDDLVHANRHRLPLPAAGARHAGDAVEPDPDRPVAVPDHVHHGAGRRADQRRWRWSRRWPGRSR